MKSGQLFGASADRLLATSFGVLGGIGTFVHGVGEVFQGNVPRNSFFFPSWTQGPIALYLDGDPALTILPTMLLAGIATLVLSTATIVWSAFFLGKKQGGLVLILLAILLLLSGGGVGPPVLTLLAGISGLGIGRFRYWPTRLLPESVVRVVALAWPLIFAVCLANGIFLTIGHVVGAYFFAPINGEIFLGSFIHGVWLMILTILTGRIHDIRHGN